MKITPSRKNVGWVHITHGVINAHYPKEAITRAISIGTPWVSVGGLKLTRAELAEALHACNTRPS